MQDHGRWALREEFWVVRTKFFLLRRDTCPEPRKAEGGRGAEGTKAGRAENEAMFCFLRLMYVLVWLFECGRILRNRWIDESILLYRERRGPERSREDRSCRMCYRYYDNILQCRLEMVRSI